MNIPSVKVPTYTMKLPFTKKEIQFRPYVVKEEKLLILAKESNDNKVIIDTIIDVVNNCTNGQLDAKTAPLFEVQYAFLQIRSKSVGESLDLVSKCHKCSNETSISVKLDDFTLKTFDNHSNKIQLESNYHVVMTYPTLKHFIDLYIDRSQDTVYNVIAECIDTIYSDEEIFKNGPGKTKEFRTFLEDLTIPQFEKIESFFLTMPTLYKMIKYNCEKCSAENSTYIDGISNFFG